MAGAADFENILRGGRPLFPLFRSRSASKFKKEPLKQRRRATGSEKEIKKTEIFRKTREKYRK